MPAGSRRERVTGSRASFATCGPTRSGPRRSRSTRSCSRSSRSTACGRGPRIVAAVCENIFPPPAEPARTRSRGGCSGRGSTGCSPSRHRPSRASGPPGCPRSVAADTLVAGGLEPPAARRAARAALRRRATSSSASRAASSRRRAGACSSRPSGRCRTSSSSPSRATARTPGRAARRASRARALRRPAPEGRALGLLRRARLPRRSLADHAALEGAARAGRFSTAWRWASRSSRRRAAGSPDAIGRGRDPRARGRRRRARRCAPASARGRGALRERLAESRPRALSRASSRSPPTRTRSRPRSSFGRTTLRTCEQTVCMLTRACGARQGIH